MTSTAKAFLVAIGLVGLLVVIRLYGAKKAETDAAEAIRGQEELAKWYAENPKTEVKVPPPAETSAVVAGSYLDSRSGPALERTVKRAIDMAGYDCDKIRSTKRASGRVYADCGSDGNYLIVEVGKDIRVRKE